MYKKSGPITYLFYHTRTRTHTHTHTHTRARARARARMHAQEIESYRNKRKSDETGCRVRRLLGHVARYNRAAVTTYTIGRD